MPKFVIDEDIPRSTGRILKQRGYDVRDIRDYGLRGAEDEEIYKFAQREKAVILTGCLLYTSPSPRDAHESRMPSSA